MNHLFKSLAAASAIALTAFTALAPASVAKTTELEESICITSYNNEELYRLPCAFAVTTHQEGYEFRGLVSPGQSLDRADNIFADHIFCPYIEGQRVVEGRQLSVLKNDMGEYELVPVQCVYSNYQLGSVRINFEGGVSREFGFFHRGVSSRFGF